MGKKKREEYEKFDANGESKRLNRVIGQIEGVQKMLDEERKLRDVLIQCRAIHSALKSIESRIMNVHLDKILTDVAKMDKKKDRSEKLAELEALFTQVE